MIANPILHFFALCSHLELTQALRLQIMEAASGISDWNAIPVLAEKHGMAPLLKRNLTQAGVVLPEPIRRDLTALALRHRLINEVRTRALTELVVAFQQFGISFRILKGAALAHILYPDVGLRPMKDMDILVRESDLEQVGAIFKNCGYRCGYNNVELTGMHHLPGFTRQADGFSLSIEVHHHLLRDSFLRPLGKLEDLHCTPLQFQLSEGMQADTLSPADMLFHLCRHSFFDNHALEPLCMIWVADILNLAEKFVHEIDWAAVQLHYPLVPHTLSCLHEIRPLSESLIQSANLTIKTNRHKSIHSYLGWPGVPMAGEKQAGVFHWLHETLFPSTWWLRLRYGVRRTTPMWLCWINHLIILCGEAWRRGLLRIRRFAGRL
jgi:hypothetical protein